MSGKVDVIKRANQLLEALPREAQITRNQFDAIVRAIYDMVMERQRVTLHSFGTFIRVDRASRRGWNARSNKPIVIPETSRLVFRSRVRFADEDEINMVGEEGD